MTISFSQIPMYLTPGAHAEFDTSKSGRSNARVKALLIGQQLASGAAETLTVKRVTSPDEAAVLFGRGSQLARMCRAWLNTDRTVELSAIALDDATGATAATQTLTLSDAPTEAGTLALMIAGQPVPVAIQSGQTPTAIATAIAAAVTANAELPMAAAAEDAVVTLTAKHKGLIGNGLDVRLNYYDEDRTPQGLTVDIDAGTAGAGDPDLASVFAAIGDARYDAFVHPYTGAANLAVIEQELASRAGAMRQLDGISYTALSGILSALEALGESRNSPQSVIGGIKALPSPAYELAAVLAARVVPAGAIDPARPWTYLTLPGIVPPAVSDRLTREEREYLLADGLSTFIVDEGGNLCIEQPITTYKTTATGIADDSLRALNAILCLYYVRASVRSMVALKYPRHKLGNDGGRYGLGQAIVTPSTMTAELIALARQWEAAAIVENVDAFIKALVVERNASDRDRLDALLPPDFVDQLLRFAAVIQPVG